MGQELEIIPNANLELIEASGVTNLLSQIRPAWQAKKLIQRVNRILPADPSSACQRIFNASIHDLKDKIIIAGLDIAEEAAKQHKLPPVLKNEDIENYSVMKAIDLAYRIGLLSRPEWKRVLRAYDIRRDLEHEDDEYEAGVEDTVYIFKTCIDIILSKDPIEVLKLTDIKDIVEENSPTSLNEAIIEDFEHAPQPRQMDIYKFLLSISMDKKGLDIVRQNSYQALYALREKVNKQVLLEIAKDFKTKVGRRAPDKLEARVANASGIFPYLNKIQIKEYFKTYFQKMSNTGYNWSNHDLHGELLREIKEIDGLNYCPDELLRDYIEWLCLCYIGESGGYGDFGRNRKVFYSNTGAPLALEILTSCNKNIYNIVDDLKNTSKKIKTKIFDKHVERRYQSILDILDE